MRAVLCRSYDSPPVLETVAVPEPGPREVRVRVHSSAFNAADLLMSRGQPLLFRPVFTALLRPGPPVLGRAFAGTIERVGEAVTDWRVGDRVCGEAAHAWAEQVVVDPSTLGRVPDGVDATVAATVPIAGVTALQGIRDSGGVQAGERVLVHGASGGVGHFAVQIAKLLGAHVTGVCSGAKADVVRAAGADAVIDYTQDRFVELGERWDVIFDVAGTIPVPECLTVLNPGGRYVASFGKNGGRLLGPLPGLFEVQLRGVFDGRVRGLVETPSVPDLQFLLDGVRNGQVVPHVGDVVALESVVEALAEFAAAGARGKTAIRIAAA